MRNKVLTLIDKKPVYKGILFDGSKECLETLIEEFSTEDLVLESRQTVCDVFATNEDKDFNITAVKLGIKGTNGLISTTVKKGLYFIVDENDPINYGTVENLDAFDIVGDVVDDSCWVNEDVEPLPILTGLDLDTDITDKDLPFDKDEVPTDELPPLQPLAPMADTLSGKED